MIDASRAQEVAERCIETAREFWQLDQNWSIWIKLATREQGEPASIYAEYNYRRAWIDLDPAQYDSEAELWRDIGHEVCHIAFASFNIVKNSEGERSRERDALWTHAVETATCQLERVFIRERPYSP